MVYWSVVFLVALAGVTASPDAVFPEDYNGRSGSRIVSGWEAEEGQFPHQISLRMVSPTGSVTACGGSIIHEEWGLTAAHCTAARTTIVVRAGVVNLTTPYYIFETTEYYNHPSYIDELQSVVQPNDIALLRFNRALTFNDLVQPIRLQSSQAMNQDYSGSVLIASGWGRTWTGGSSPENMNWVYLRGVSNDLCALAYSNSPIIQDSTICAMYYNVTSQSTCQGDSGGVLAVYDVDDELSQVGVTSFVSSSGCHTDIPAGFIRTGHYHRWYKQVTGINFDWTSEGSGTTAAPTTADTTDTATETIETTQTVVTSETTEVVDNTEPASTIEPTETTELTVTTESTVTIESTGTTEVAETVTTRSAGEQETVFIDNSIKPDNSLFKNLLRFW